MPFLVLAQNLFHATLSCLSLYLDRLAPRYIVMRFPVPAQTCSMLHGQANAFPCTCTNLFYATLSCLSLCLHKTCSTLHCHASPCTWTDLLHATLSCLSLCLHKLVPRYIVMPLLVLAQTCSMLIRHVFPCDLVYRMDTAKTTRMYANSPGFQTVSWQSNDIISFSSPRLTTTAQWNRKRLCVQASKCQKPSYINETTSPQRLYSLFLTILLARLLQSYFGFSFRMAQQKRHKWNGLIEVTNCLRRSRCPRRKTCISSWGSWPQDVWVWLRLQVPRVPPFPLDFTRPPNAERSLSGWKTWQKKRPSFVYYGTSQVLLVIKKIPLQAAKQLFEDCGSCIISAADEVSTAGFRGSLFLDKLRP